LLLFDAPKSRKKPTSMTVITEDRTNRGPAFSVEAAGGALDNRRNSRHRKDRHS
jgi:hypothetical protein